MRMLSYLLFVVFTVNLYGNDIVAFLKRVENNHTLHMNARQHSFVCSPYGVETVSELMHKTDVDSSCIGHLYEFRKANPKEKYFAVSSLYIQQQYSVEGFEGKCLLKLSSGHSYSEALLENGYARIPPGMQYKDTVLKHRFKRAEQRAKKKKAGIWSDINVRNCFLIAEKK